MFWGHQDGPAVNTANVSRGRRGALKVYAPFGSIFFFACFPAACWIGHITPCARSAKVRYEDPRSCDRNGVFTYFFSPVEGAPQATEKRHFLQLCAWIGTVSPTHHLPPLSEKNGAVLAQCSGERWGGRERGGWAPCCLGQ